MTTVPAEAPLSSWAVEESAEELYEQAPCGYVSTAADGTVVRVNETLLRWLGHERQDLVGRRRFADLVAAGPRVVWLTHHVPVLAAQGQVSGVFLDLVRADGEVLPVLVGARLVRGTELSPPLVRITVFDASERRAYESSLVAARSAAERAERRARALQVVTGACATATTPEELVATAVRATAEAYGTGGCGLWLGDDLPTLALATSFGSLPDVPLEQLVSGGAAALRAVWQQQSVVVDETTRAASLEAGWASEHRVALVPVHHAGRSLGVLALVCGAVSGLSADEEPVLGALGLLVGMALSRTRLYVQLHQQALHDDLTGLANRALLTEQLGQALARAERTREPLAVLLIDLDGFKQVNDTLGHAAGDALLVVCAQRLRAAARDSDRLARLGGDEFVVVSEGTDQAAAEAEASRLAARLSEPVDLLGQTVSVGASIGVAVRTPAEPHLDGQALLARADAAMYDVKAGRAGLR